ncbi:long-chain acyl-CoA synthetase [Parabacteroides sp. PF5-5]|uniref:AMP-binding protein n=1 Tax=unclassified Parabacteroides TaxID=2649774 RepID=UPI0024761792|nr:MULTISPECIES: AMP-binding protein [unclassified Parabacteroides]MDH6304349.1 long-chain acyl-CoA synthetase [Parabacteroides sp. PH5-39]MDH6315498.1 long-chain acyl-CoA synthetase [Parabacteroides sp. PF5-13]MDH6319008.1 long-chain acyl-CoA synthetase [Parabacteroides sp. PH5-13]MDH6322737.1 long-chain acyl-CoA synthetase [Parabacteroides sp. PH5-8]MDH6326691.1 long-chain acyl-CoA synthetase [Parabacteroides sp. PH5-41]
MESRFLGIIENSIREYWDLPAFSDYKGEPYYYRDVALRIEKLHIVFEHAGIKKGDKVALVGRNSSNWAVSFFGTLAYGAVIVPILHDFKPDNIHHIVNHSEAKAVLVGGNNWENLDENMMPDVKLFMLLDDFSIIKSDEPEVFAVREQIDEYLNKKYPNGFSPDMIAYHREDPEELAVLNYTSGTTSFSKGVMLPYRSIWSNTKYANENVPFVHAGDNIVCMLPMAHMYGLAFEILNSVGKGCHVHFLTRTPSPKIVADAFTTLRPSLILAVPLIIEKIVKSRVFPELEKPHIKFLLKIPGINKRILNTVARKLDIAFGENYGEIVVGGAALNKEVENFLRLIKFRYTVGYGLTECGPLVAYEQWDTFKKGSVGRIVDRLEVKIDSPDPETHVGEIFVRGANNMLGYYKNEEATKAVMLEDGWMNTGDLGLLDNDGFLYIRGRSKTMILSSNGQNIYPEEIEDLLNNKSFVAESLVISEGYKLIALIYPDWELLSKEGLNDRQEVDRIMQQNMDELNAELPTYSKLSSFRIYEEEFEKTPKRSIKRYLYQPKE